MSGRRVDWFTNARVGHAQARGISGEVIQLAVRVTLGGYLIQKLAGL